MFKLWPAFLLFIAFPLIAVAQTPAAKATAAPKPAGTLQEIMRAIYFPNSNLIFDVQQHNPGEAKPNVEGAPADRYATVYSGWEKVEYAAIALIDGADLILTPGRACQNGQPVPVRAADYRKFVREMRTAGLAALQAARARDQEKVSDATNDLTESCANCHQVYRRGPAEGTARCTPPRRKP